MPDANTERKNIKVALEAAHAEISKAITRVDHAQGADLEVLKSGARHLASFVDFNSGCGKGVHTASELLSKLSG
jgi:hypothetical protein